MSIYKNSLKKCEMCGGLFIPRRAHTKTCSNLCRLRLWRGTTIPTGRPLLTSGVIGITPPRNPKKVAKKGRPSIKSPQHNKIKTPPPIWSPESHQGKKRRSRKPAKPGKST